MPANCHVRCKKLIDNNLIFLISQPRSGSTLLQKLLSRNSRIYSVAEPWIMLHPIYSLKKSGVYSEYDRKIELQATEAFINNMPGGGKKLYFDRLKDMYLGFYDAYLQTTDKDYFLDKTPRYYFILKELMELYPNAKFIILRRNPLSVLYSIINTWTKDSDYRLLNLRHDLQTAIANLDEYSDVENVFQIKYESLVDNPEATLSGLCQYIGIDYEENMLTYDSKEKWELGDQKVYENKKISSGLKYSWGTDKLSHQAWRNLHDYMEWIGQGRMKRLGYDYNKLRTILYENMPSNNYDRIMTDTRRLDDLLNISNNCLFQNEKLNVGDIKNPIELHDLCDVCDDYSKLKERIDHYAGLDVVHRPMAKIKSLIRLLAVVKSIVR